MNEPKPLGVVIFGNIVTGVLMVLWLGLIIGGAVWALRFMLDQFVKLRGM